ncbi:MAG: flagellar motor switch protein FliM [Verrucomicrobiota bacterium]|jgi:flagellar motor switch protein FliM
MAGPLNQSDIDRLVAEAAGSSASVIYRSDGERFPSPKQVNARAFDFRTPIHLAEAELRRLRTIHSGFISTISARFSSLLRADMSLKLSRLLTMPYAKFSESMKNPTHISLFKVDQLPGIGILEINPRLAISMTNRMLGGRGLTSEEERYLTEIEIALLEEIVDIIVQEWCRQWKDERHYTGRQIGHENNPRFLQACSADTVTLVLTIEALAGDTVEQIQLGIPYNMLEPIVKSMHAKRSREMQSASDVKPQQWRTSYNQIAVPLIADWEVPGAAVSDILSMRVGDIIEMPKATLSHTRVRIANAPRFIAQTGTENGHVAIQISSEIPNATNP